jgi:glycosyltransferase involved in cell wall biosynthesis
LPRMLIATTVPVTLETFLLPHVEHLRAGGWEVDGMAAGVASSDACVQAFDRVEDVMWSRRPLDPANLEAVRTVRRAVGSGRYDVVHVHTPVAGFVTRYALRGRGLDGPALVYTAHGFHFTRGRHTAVNSAYVALERLAGRWTDHLVVINAEDERQASALGIMPANRVTRVPGVGIDARIWSRRAGSPQSSAASREAAGIAPGERYAVCVGEFNPGKRHVDVIAAFAAGAADDLALVLLGDGPELGRCRALAERLGVTGRVHFLGHRHDVREIVAGASVMLHASVREGLPRAVMEAMSLEVPVVGADARGTRDLLEGGRGVLVPARDVDALGSALRRVLADPSGSAVMAAAARAFVLEELALPHVLAEMDDVYATVLAGRSQRR